MNINLVLPYENTEKELFIWAYEEKQIDFRKERFRATRCTVAYAAVELIKYLTKLSCQVTYTEHVVADVVNIFLEAHSEEYEEDEFFMIPVSEGLKIVGKGRVGVLYGAYEFLRMQGIRWLNLDDEIGPDVITQLKMPSERKDFASDMPLGRGFDFEGLLKDSTKLWQWMARNHMNLSAYRPYTAAFQKKLGMSFKMGGHIFERILNPDQIVTGNQIMWDVHRDWYGKKDDNLATDKENALKTQFCMSNQELLVYLSEAVLHYLNHDWYQADRVDLWTFDTWGNTCQCSKCKALGNSTDQTLYFLSFVRDYIDKARADGRLDHDVRLITCAYEGTETLQPPSKKIPRNLQNGKDYIVFYPIKRCYKHTLNDSSCCDNLKYARALEGWSGMPMMVGEYYNVSKFEDLPYLFSKVMFEDFKYYKSRNIKGMTYMHLPMAEWGVRNLTQSLYAQLCRNVDTEGEAFLTQYFGDRYGEQAIEVRKAYTLVEEASAYAASWRAWGAKSVLTGLLHWNGHVPMKPLYQGEHLGGEAISIGEDAVNLLNQALNIMKECRLMRIKEIAKMSNMPLIQAMNPFEQAKNKKDIKIGHYDEDVRLLMYGRDVMLLTILFLKYYDGLLNGRDVEDIWKKIDELATDLSYRYMPFTYINSEDNIELLCKDMLERSQLRSTYYNCIEARWHKQ